MKYDIHREIEKMLINGIKLAMRQGRTIPEGSELDVLWDNYAIHVDW